MEWFAEIIDRELEKRGSMVALAKAWGMDRNSLENWRTKSSFPRLDHVEKVLAMVGGDIRRALPDFVPVVMNEELLSVFGKISAGVVQPAIQESAKMETTDSIWKKSRFRSLTTGKPILLEVQGHSMEPEFPDGSFVVCAKPATNKLPEYTPVIARIQDEATLKIYHKTKDARGNAEVELIPINPSFKTLRYIPEEVSVDYIALGTICPWQQGYTKQTEKPLLMRDSK